MTKQERARWREDQRIAKTGEPYREVEKAGQLSLGLGETEGVRSVADLAEWQRIGQRP